MDRRSFLKRTTLGAGAITLTSVLPEIEAYGRDRAETPLSVEGWIKEPARDIAVVDDADVVVVGGGPAGFAAAISAARQGVKVILLERQYFLGGLFTGCGVTPIINMYHPRANGDREQAVTGICQELCEKLDAEGMICVEKGCRPKADPEAAKYFMEEMINDSSVRMIYGVDAVQVIKGGDAVKAVILEGKSGRVAVKTKFVVDCTGDGDLLAWMGEDFNVYKDNIGAMWRIGNAANSPKGDATPVKGVRTRHTVGERMQDGLDMYNLTRIQVKLRKMMWEDAKQLRANPGCEDLFLLDTPSVVGVRVTRVLNSIGNVTVAGAAEGKSYKDVIGLAGGDSTLTYGDKKILRTDRPVWQVPYSSLVPKKTHNLLVGGRCFGYERGLTYDAREVGTCLMTGQAAGTAAALAVLNRCSCRDVNILKLQKVLRENNVKLDL